MVFTGIAEEMGAVVSMERQSDLLLWDNSRGEGWVLKVRMEKGLVDAYQGASIAINGVCLTVLEWPVTDGVVSFGVAPETIRLTNLVPPARPARAPLPAPDRCACAGPGRPQARGQRERRTLAAGGRAQQRPLRAGARRTPAPPPARARDA